MSFFKTLKENKEKKKLEYALKVAINGVYKEKDSAKNREQLIKTIAQIMEIMDFSDENGEAMQLSQFEKYTNQELIETLEYTLIGLQKKYGLVTEK